MKVCIIGAGAIGGLLGARLAAAGDCALSAVARGATLDALRRHGWRLRQRLGGDGIWEEVSVPARVTGTPADLGPQDLLIIAVKGPALGPVAAAIAPLLGPATTVLPAMNGVPWWFLHDVGGIGSAPLHSVDPDGSITAALPLARVLGAVVHITAATPAPGLVEHRMGNGLIIGEPDGVDTPRLRATRDLLAGAGFAVTASPVIRQDIWYKLWGNLTMNPVSALTGATTGDILDDPLLAQFCADAMREAAAIGARIGCAIDQSPEDRQALTRNLGAFKTSMLQDVESGRPLELDGIVTAVHEIGRRLGIPCPNIDALLGLTRVFARQRGLYPADEEAAS